jgi:hypothetical protein
LRILIGYQGTMVLSILQRPLRERVALSASNARASIAIN